jgi:gas vesicle protein
MKTRARELLVGGLVGGLIYYALDWLDASPGEAYAVAVGAFVGGCIGAPAGLRRLARMSADTRRPKPPSSALRT